MGKPVAVNNYTYNATVDRVIDGDSFIALFDVGFHLSMKVEVRVFGMNAPEHGTVDGEAATAFAQSILPAGTDLVIKTHSPTANAGFEKYGRWLAEVTTNGQSYADLMIASGHAVAYFGGAR